MNPDYGWELLKFNLGYQMKHYKDAKTQWSADGDDAFTTNEIPYLIFYNRFTSKLRVMAYLPDSDVGTEASVTLSTDDKSKIFTTNQASDTQFFVPSTQGIGKINNVTDGGWGIADFALNLDPCAPASDNVLTVQIQPEITEDITLYGHATSISENITDTKDIDPQAYLMNVSGDLDANLAQAGNFVAGSSSELNDLFSNINDSATSFAVADDALNAAGEFLGALMDLTPESASVKKGLTALGGVSSGIGSVFGTQAAAVPNYSPIMPQLSFSEIYLRGEGTTGDPGVTFQIRLPGSLSSTTDDSLAENAATGEPAFALYDEPMGLFTLLTTPQVEVQKAYGSRNDSKGYPLTTTFIPANVVFAYNAQSGLQMTTGEDPLTDGLNVYGRLKINYLVQGDAEPTFNNLHDADGDDSTFDSIKTTTNGKSTKLYTVVTDNVPLSQLYNKLHANPPSIEIDGTTAVVDQVSLVVTLLNNPGVSDADPVLHDSILDTDITMPNKTDEDGEFVPYYIYLQAYPVKLHYGASGASFDPDTDIKRLIDTGQIANANYTVDSGVEIALGNTETKIAGYCLEDGEYNTPYQERDDGTNVIIYADEDMSYYAYNPKQVNHAGDDYVNIAVDVCSFCAHSKTWPFFSFNLREYIERYGNTVPTKVDLRLQLASGSAANGLTLMDYASDYLVSANKSTAKMTSNDWDAKEPNGASNIQHLDQFGNSVYFFDVTEQFNNAIKRISSGSAEDTRYELPRTTFVLDGDYAGSNRDIHIIASESTENKPQLLVHF